MVKSAGVQIRYVKADNDHCNDDDDYDDDDHTSNCSISLVYTGSDPLQLFNIKKVNTNGEFDDRSSTASLI